MHMQNLKIQAFCIAAMVALSGSLSAADEASSGSPAAVQVAFDTTE